MGDLLEMAAQYRAQIGLDALDLSDRPRAVSLVTQACALLAEDAEMLFGLLWKLISDLEAGASDEVTCTGMRYTAVQLAGLMLELYELADLLGFSRIDEVVERVHAMRMAQDSSRVRVEDLIALPGA